MTNNNTQANNISQWINWENKADVIEVSPAANDKAQEVWNWFFMHRGDATPESVRLIKSRAHHWFEAYKTVCEVKG